MSEDGPMTTDPADGSDVGERRRALQAERERRAQRDLPDEPPPAPPTSLVRPYARMASPTGPIRTPAAEEDPEVAPEETAVVDEDVDEGSDEPVGERNAGQDSEVRVGAPDLPVGETAESPGPWPESVERLRATPAALRPSGSSPALPATAAPEPPAPEPPAAEPPAPEPPAAEPPAPEPPAPESSEPEPPAHDDLEPHPSVLESTSERPPPEPPEPAELPEPPERPSEEPAESPELPADDVPRPDVGRARELPHPPGGDDWAELSLRVGDDDAWLRGLRESLVVPGGAADDLGPDPDEPTVPEPAPPPPPDDADADVREVETVADDAVGDDAVPEQAVADEVVVQDETRDDEAFPDDRMADDVPREEAVPDEPTRLDADPPVTPYPPFRRPPAERLTRALTDDPAGGTAGRSSDEAVARHERVRGTLEPVLRRSTERAKVVPVIRPPMLPPEPGDDGPAAVGTAAVSWDEAMGADVVPSRKRPGRRPARARHESGGAEEYRPRAGADRSLTLLVLGMLLVLAVLVGVAVWAFWPRAAGPRSLPPVTITGQPAARSF
jgi:hypothetical protein